MCICLTWLICFISSHSYLFFRGSAIARIVGDNVKQLSSYHDIVKLWVFEETLKDGRKLSEVINEEHENVKYLPGFKIPDNVVCILSIIRQLIGTPRKQMQKLMRLTTTTILGCCDRHCWSSTRCWHPYFCHAPSILGDELATLEGKAETRSIWCFSYQGLSNFLICITSMDCFGYISKVIQ